MIKVGQFKAETFTELFDNTKALEWENYIPKNGKFWVTKAILLTVNCSAALNPVNC